MSDTALRTFLRVVIILGAFTALVSASVLIGLGRLVEDSVLGAVLSVAFAVLAWVVASAQPRNRFAWVLIALVPLISTSTAGLALIALNWPEVPIPLEFGDIPAEFPAGAVIITGLSSALSGVGFFGMLTFGLLLFPDGRLPSRRWRWVAIAAALGLVMIGIGNLVDWQPSNTEAVGSAGGLFGAIALFVWLVPLLCLASLVVRYRNSEGDVRDQIKWIVWGAAMFVVGSIFGVMSGISSLTAVGFASLGASYGIAITRHRLYDIDVVISRTVVLAILAGFITVTYALIVVGVGQLIGRESDGLLLPIGATALVAVAFEPVRHRAQRWANRLVYGSRATPYEVLGVIAESMSAAEHGEGVLARLAALLQEGTGAERATVWLGDRGSMVAAATSPPDAVAGASVDLSGDGTYPVTHDGEIVGALEVVKSRGAALSSAERSLIADLAGSAGAVLGYQRLNDSLSRRATELEESRARLLGVQDAERRRLELELHEGAEQFIVALKVKMGVASQLAARAGDQKLEELLDDLTNEAQAALDDVQSLAKGIYPPVLEAEGLGAAVSALASSTPVEVQFDRDSLGRYPAETEAAVYFGVSEAVTNAVKHAKPPIHIELTENASRLSFSVTDNGPGFNIDKSEMGSGLENMTDRLESVGGILEVTSAEGSQTKISGTIPV